VEVSLLEGRGSKIKVKIMHTREKRGDENKVKMGHKFDLIWGSRCLVWGKKNTVGETVPGKEEEGRIVI